MSHPDLTISPEEAGKMIGKSLLGTADVKRILDVTEDRVYQLIATGVTLPSGRIVKLPASNFGTVKRATWKFKLADVEAFINETRVCDAPPQPVHRRAVALQKRYVVRRPANSV